MSFGGYPLIVIAAFVITVLACLYRIAEIKVESMTQIQFMSETIKEMMKEHDKELTFEKNKISAHCIKMKMQKRDFMAKLGGLQRKLRDKHEVVKCLNQKLVSLEWAEEDANDLVDELIDARETIREKDDLIESLTRQLKQSGLLPINALSFNKTIQESEEENNEN